MSEWISVKKRLPKPNMEDVLVTDGENVCEGVFTLELGWLCSDDINSNDITHWTPLPEPPHE